MKLHFCKLLLIGLALAGCSSDDRITYENELTIREIKYPVSKNTESENNIYITKSTNGTTNVQRFYLVKRGQSGVLNDTLYLKVDYPSNRRIDGTYEVIQEPTSSGYYRENGIKYELIGGTVNIDYLGGGIYWVNFNTYGRLPASADNFNIDGYFKGAFKEL